MTFTASGPLDDFAAVRLEGAFEARRFRFSSPTPLPNATVLFIPVQVARGRFKQTDRRLVFSGLALETSSYAATGTAAFDLRLPVTVSTEIRVETDDWRSLPAMPADALPELTGGHFTGLARLNVPLAKLAEAHVDGSFQLRDASYQPWEATAPAVQVSGFGAQYRWDGSTLHLPEVTLRTPVGDADAEGRVYAQPAGYRLALDIAAHSAEAGGLLARFNADLHLQGGSARASMQLDAPVESLAEALVTGTVDLRGGVLAHPVEPLGLPEVPVETLALDFARTAGGWNFARIALTSPGLTANLSGRLTAEVVDADVVLEVADWRPPIEVPLSGGAISLRGHVIGEPARPETLAFDGRGRLEGARLRFARDGFGAEGGSLTLDGRFAGALGNPDEWTLDGRATVSRVLVSADTEHLTLAPAEVDLAAEGAGRLTDPLAWLLSARVQARALDLAFGDREAPHVEEVAIALRREGDRLVWRDARLCVAGGALTTSGSWGAGGHAIEVAVRVTDLAPFGLHLPDGVGAPEYRFTGSLSGDAERPLHTASGLFEASGFRVRFGELPAQVLESVSARVTYDERGLRIEAATAAGPLGTVTAAGAVSEAGHRVTLEFAGDDFARTGIPLPEGFGIGAFAGRVELEGTVADPAAGVSGSLTLLRARFPFGPEGPHGLDRVTGEFRWEDGRARFTEVVGVGPAGEFRGSGTVATDGYRLDLAGSRVALAVARWLVPGEMRAGALRGTLTLTGGPDGAARGAAGSFELTEAVYVPPPALGAGAEPLELSRLAGRYEWTPETTVVTDLALAGPLLSGTGAVRIRAGLGEADADLRARDLGALAGRWAVLAGRLRGGTGEAKVAARFQEGEARGSVAITGKGGVLVLPGAEGDFAEHPVESVALTLGFEPERLTFQGGRLRGPQINGDVEGVWAATGPIRFTGRAWLTSAFTRRLLPRGLLGTLARLVGIRAVSSDFTLTGTAQRVMLSASIARTFLWRLAKGSVPAEFRAMAEGKEPVFVAAP